MEKEMTFCLGAKSQLNLREVHPDLKRLVEAVIKVTNIDFAVTEGLRTKERQVELLEAGATTTMNSRHITGHAVDVAALVGGKVTWQAAAYHKISEAFFSESQKLNIPIAWGGNWKTFADLVHFELDRKFYP